MRVLGPSIGPRVASPRPRRNFEFFYSSRATLDNLGKGSIWRRSGPIEWCDFQSRPKDAGCVRPHLTRQSDSRIGETARRSLDAASRRVDLGGVVARKVVSASLSVAVSSHVEQGELMRGLRHQELSPRMPASSFGRAFPASIDDIVLNGKARRYERHADMGKLHDPHASGNERR